MSIGTLISTVCRRVGMTEQMVERINWDTTIKHALNGIQPNVPIIPRHFADFFDHDPPLIDLSIDYNDSQIIDFGASSYCIRKVSRNNDSKSVIAVMKNATGYHHYIRNSRSIQRKMSTSST